MENQNPLVMFVLVAGDGNKHGFAQGTDGPLSVFQVKIPLSRFIVEGHFQSFDSFFGFGTHLSPFLENLVLTAEHTMRHSRNPKKHLSSECQRILYATYVQFLKFLWVFSQLSG
jgi:hypothetical protein